ncbi:hypothetical protein MCOR27_000889 [Pyricularia oryzae]|uniref:Uncharacterized protein n=4 Tax=Pyricularia TaxID=48558 RepID=A0ABQ8NVF5_PYRGI|nr:uncharacterized protein MGG_17543 [Pyricularia oryzae 70-15]ELQ42262.1 hypothetical protein OOU_Y34scaffold00217g4 [Pyricularia oryzae Y34]KAH9433236.1 hypothetical protein MCOR02_005291 [Pyricularia oryzae]KAI6302158.1 hypothetical protein MCOR33_002474 [Pyricularia grisea]EHA49489.1 hypothetical protein MGG_17543 [Pyricularia oryzae 70-15]KAI6261499.1 hypothetical protein MCOR19_002195 [Pyricularia oryzae]
MWTKAAWAGPITLSWRNFAFNAWVTSACTVNASQFSGNNSRRLPDLPVRARGDLDRCRQDVKMSSTKIEAIDTLRQIVGLVLLMLRSNADINTTSSKIGDPGNHQIWTATEFTQQACKLP